MIIVWLPKTLLGITDRQDRIGKAKTTSKPAARFPVMVIEDNLQVVDAGMFQNVKQVTVEFLPAPLIALPIEWNPDRADPACERIFMESST
jgi:hypothetical protein